MNIENGLWTICFCFCGAVRGGGRQSVEEDNGKALVLMEAGVASHVLHHETERERERDGIWAENYLQTAADQSERLGM